MEGKAMNWYFDSEEIINEAAERINALEYENGLLQRSCQAYEWGVADLKSKLEAAQRERDFWQENYNKMLSMYNDNAHTVNKLVGIIGKLKEGASNEQ